MLFWKASLILGEVLVFLAGGVMTPLWVAFITNSYQLFLSLLYRQLPRPAERRFGDTLPTSDGRSWKNGTR